MAESLAGLRLDLPFLGLLPQEKTDALQRGERVQITAEESAAFQVGMNELQFNRITELETELGSIHAELESTQLLLAHARRDAAAALDLVSRIRLALGDNGKRMQDELVAFCRELAEARR